MFSNLLFDKSNKSDIFLISLTTDRRKELEKYSIVLLIILISSIVINTAVPTSNKVVLSNKIVLLKLLFSTRRLVTTSYVNEKATFNYWLILSYPLSMKLI